MSWIPGTAFNPADGKLWATRTWQPEPGDGGGCRVLQWVRPVPPPAPPAPAKVEAPAPVKKQRYGTEDIRPDMTREASEGVLAEIRRVLARL